MSTSAAKPVDLDAGERSPLAELISLAAPTVAQMASYTVMQFLDTLMLSRIGEAEATAAGNSGLLGFAIISFGVGVLWVVNTLVSQSYGRRDFAACGRYVWQGVWFSMVMSIVLAVMLPLAPRMFHAFGHEPKLAALETTYIQIVLSATAIKLFGTAVGQFLLGVDRPRAVMVCSIVGVSVNAVVAWAMLFGHLGFHPMGIAGAAWAQNIGVLFETAALTCFAMQPKLRSTYRLLDWKPRYEALKTLIVVGVPAGTGFIADILAWSIFSVWVMGQFGTRAMAANTFMLRYMSVSFMPAFGISAAVTALVGRYIGRGRHGLAVIRANLGFKVAAAYMLTCGMIFVLGRHLLIGLFTTDPQVLHTGALLLVFGAIYQFFDAVYITYNGALRGAGDTVVPAVATILLCWSITVVGGYLVAHYIPKWGPAGPWTVATIYGVILGVFIYVRFRLGGWRSIHLERRDDADTVPGFEKSSIPAPDTAVSSTI